MGLKTISDEVVEHTVSFLLDVYGINSVSVTKSIRYKIDAYNLASISPLKILENLMNLKNLRNLRNLRT